MKFFREVGRRHHHQNSDIAHDPRGLSNDNNMAINESSYQLAAHVTIMLSAHNVGLGHLSPLTRVDTFCCRR